MKTKIINKLGRRGKIGLAVLIAFMFIGAASAGLLTYYGKVTTTANVSQSVLLDGNDYTTPVTNSFSTIGGCCECFAHNLENRGCSDAEVDIVTTGTPDLDGIDVYALAPIYNEYDTYGEAVEATIVKEWSCCTVTWTVNIISENVPHGLYGVGLIISLDGWTPDFNVWYAESGAGQGVPSVGWYYQEYPWGTNIPIAQVPWITVNANGQHFEISIDCNHLGCCGATYYWNMQLRTNLISWVDGVYDWSASFVGIENHVGIPITFPYTLEPNEILYFNLCYKFDIAIIPGTYYITTQFQPVITT